MLVFGLPALFLNANGDERRPKLFAREHFKTNAFVSDRYMFKTAPTPFHSRTSMNPAIDVSTHQLAQLTEKAMGGKVGLDEILAVWHEIGELQPCPTLQPKLSHRLQAMSSRISLFSEKLCV